MATLQHITYNEFLPRVLNLETRDKYGLVLKEDGYYNEYTGQCYAEITNEFTTAAFRYQHQNPDFLSSHFIFYKFSPGLDTVLFELI